MHQHGALVHEVKRAHWEIVGPHVVAQHLEIGERQLGEEPSVQIRRGDYAVRADLLAQPTGDRTAAAAYLQAPDARSEPELLDPADRDRIQPLLQQLETASRVLVSVRKRVAIPTVTHVLDLHAAMARRRSSSTRGRAAPTSASIAGRR